MRTCTSTVAIALSGVLIAGSAWAQSGAGAPSGSSTTGAGSAADKVQSGERPGSESQGGSVKQESNHKARGRADAGNPGQGERDSSGKDASTSSAGVGTQDGTKQTVKQVQQALKDKGQDPGTVDGVMGAKTQAALKAYQKEHGLEATGQLDTKTRTSLGL